MKKGFIFDLDGVIVDTAKYHFAAWKKLAHSLGFEFTEEQNELFKGVSRKRCLEILLNDIGKVSYTQKDFDHWMIEKNEDYLHSIAQMDASEILPGVTVVLEYLQANSIPIALGSASKNAQPILEKVGLFPYFNTIVDGNHVTKAKPDPEVFLIAADQLQVNAIDCIVFEDAVAGIQAANTAKMTSIGIGDQSVLSNAKFNFKDFTEISINFINRLIVN